MRPLPSLASPTLLAALFALLAASGCGRDPGDETQRPPRQDSAYRRQVPDTGEIVEPPRSTPKPHDVPVTLRNFVIDMPHTLQPGPTAFHLKNDGDRIHGFAVVDAQGHRLVAVDDLDRNESRTVRAELTPGEYDVLCPVGNHAEHGMRLKVTVAARPGEGR